MTPNESRLSNFQTDLHSHGIMGFYHTFLANTKYCFWIYYRPVTHNDIRVGGVASNIAGWTEIAPHYYQDGWYRVGQFRDGTVTVNKSDSIFTSFYCPSAVTGKPISIDFCCPHLIKDSESIKEEDGYFYDDFYLEEPDSSGYVRHGTMTSKPEFTTDSPRHEGCYIMNNCHIISPTFSSNGLSNSYTFSWWSKHSDLNGKMAWGFSNGNRLNLYPAGTNFCWNTGDGSDNPFKNDNGIGITFSPY